METDLMLVDLDLENICRVCLTQHERLVSLFTTQIVAGCITRMSRMVQYCLDITVDEDDILSKKICETCKTTVISFFTFKERCKRTEKLLLESLQKVQPSISTPAINTDEPNGEKVQVARVAPTIKPGTSLPLETTQHDTTANANNNPSQSDETPYAEELPENGFDEPILETNIIKEDEDEIAEEDEGEEEAFIVPTQEPDTYAINLIYELPHGVKEEIGEHDSNHESIVNEPHQEQEDISSQPEDEEETTMSDDNVYLCDICQKIFNRNEFLNHGCIKRYLCDDCLDSFETEAELHEHQTIEHKSDDTVQYVESRTHGTLYCSICKKRQSSKEHLLQHQKMHEALSITMGDKFEHHECRQCHIVYLKPEDLSNHMSFHDGQEVAPQDDDCTDYQFLEDEKGTTVYTCGFCRLSYSTMDDMRSHLIIHFDSFSCPFDMCGCEYDTFSRLSVHIMKKHFYGDQRLCPHCREAQFDSFADLQDHIRNGCSAKKFECHHCDKKFYSRKAIALHLKTSGSQNYQCMECSKTFAQKGELTLHLRTHTGEKPFKCTICDRAYRTASMRAAHMDAHIEGKTFQCNVCMKMFQSRTSHRNHMKRHTAGKIHKCDRCEKSFYTKYRRDVHISKTHNKVKESSERYFFGFIFTVRTRGWNTLPG